MDNTLRDKILNLSQEKIYSIYFGISVQDISWSTIHNFNKLHNPFREDNDPSLSFKWFGDKLIVRDWADSRYSGDVFKVVGYIQNRNCYVNSQFVDICNKILDDYHNYKSSNTEEYKIIAKEKEIYKIDCKPRILQKRDYNFYNAFGITNKSVDLNVKAVMRYSINDKLTGYRNAFNDPCYKYTLNTYYTKLYFPNRHKKSLYPRFVTNNVLQIDDITDIVPSADIILVKSIKDKMLSNQFLDTLSEHDIKIHTSSSESPTFKHNIISLLKSNVRYNIYSMFDGDNTGINSMLELEKQYGIKPLTFSTNPNAKDPTDFYKTFGYDKTFTIYKQIISQIKHNRKQL